MKILVTGGAGFIGSHLAENLHQKRMDVVVVDDLSGGRIDNLPPNIKFIQCSINNYETLKCIFDNEKFDYIYHAAAYAAESLSHNIRRFNYENNLIGSINLINLSILYKIKCFVFTSSVAVYGHTKYLIRESSRLAPIDPYGIAKLAVELDLKAAHENFGLNSIVFRPHNVYGEKQNLNDRYRNVISIFINQIYSGKPMTIFGNGEQTRSFTYIDDVISIISDSAFNANAYNNIFNIGSDQAVSLNAVSELLSDILNLPHRVVYLKERNETSQNIVSHALAKKHFGVQQGTSLEIGLRKMIEWVDKSNRIVDNIPFKDVEIPFGLPEGW